MLKNIILLQIRKILVLSICKPYRRWAQLALSIIAQCVKQAAEADDERLCTRGVDEHLLIKVSSIVARVYPDYPHRAVIARRR